jgi:hypothetical protein
MLRETTLVDAVEEGPCDPKAVPERLHPLVGQEPEFQMVVLSCGAGLKCVRDTLPGVRLIPASTRWAPA